MRVLVASFLCLLVVASTSASSCSLVETVEDRGYHSRCDLSAFNNYKSSLQKELIHQRLLTTGYGSVPNQETKVCPTESSSGDVAAAAAAAAAEETHQSSSKGQDTVWFVENTSKTPVVISFVFQEQDGGVGVEYSAVNRKVLATNDPEALLQPKEWKAIHAFEGDVFRVRSSGEHAELLLQHRVGLVPIGKKPPSPDAGAQPMPPHTIKAQESTRQPLADYDWTTCNVVDIGFRNQGPEPVNGFWVDASTCQEHLKFQLGLDGNARNFAFDLDSNTKFEKSYVGHSFVFRTPDGDFVDSYTIQPTQVVDCPKRRTEKALITESDGLELPVLQAHKTNATFWQQHAANHAASSETVFLSHVVSARAETASY